MLKTEKSQEGKLATETRSPLANGDRVSVEQAIFATIAYYDYFNYPLTAAEIYYYLIKPDIHGVIASTSLAGGVRGNPEVIAPSAGLLRRFAPRNDSSKPSFLEISETLDSSEKLNKTIGHKNGFYFLAGREEIVEQRIRRKKLTDQKLKGSKWILKFISLLPFVRFVAISGSMGIGNPDKQSDIDLLVISKHGRIWTARAFLTFFVLIFGAYRHSDKTANRLCLNHYITDKSLAIDFGNLYKAQEYLNLFPVAGNMRIYRKFISANAEWIKRYIYLNPGESGNKNLFFIQKGNLSAAIKRATEFLLSGTLGDWLEDLFKKIQIYYIKKNPLTSHPHSRIRYTDENLVFHPILVEPKIIAEYEEKVRKFGITSA